MASDNFNRRDYLYRLRRVEQEWESADQRAASTGAHFHGIISTTNSRFRQSGIVTSMRNTYRRVETVEKALDYAKPLAMQRVMQRLQGISIADIEDILFNIVRDIALYVGGSTAAGGLIGGGIGAFAFGAGAIPGAAIGSALGAEVGNLILAFTGLKSIAVFMKDAVPAACREYRDGFNLAWGSRDYDREPNAHFASSRFASGHVIFLMALLMGIVAYLSKKGDFSKLLVEVGNSTRLGPKMAGWLGKNKDKLLNNPGLKASVSSGGGAGEDALSKLPPPRRGQSTQIGGQGNYGDLKDNLQSGFQAHHLNQNAAFEDVIPKKDGFSIGLKGNAFTEPGTPHYEFHKSMEEFWDSYRKNGDLFGERPTNSEYGTAVTDALKSAGISDTESQSLSNLAAQNRAAFNLQPDSPVPRIPGKIYQSTGE